MSGDALGKPRLRPQAWLGGHVLEFRDAAGAVCSATEVETGGEYELVVTTEAGLWRYAMGDLVRITGWLGGAPRMVFLRKAGSFLNATGEKVTEEQVLAAGRRAFPGAVGLCAATEWCDPPRVVVAVEGAAPGDFDLELQRENLEYASKRESGRLAPAQVRVEGALGRRHPIRHEAAQPGVWITRRNRRRRFWWMRRRHRNRRRSRRSRQFRRSRRRRRRRCRRRPR
jgi:hypothetical protein